MTTLDALNQLLGAMPGHALPGLRRQAEEDAPLLRELFVARRWQEFSAAPGWSDAQRLAFLHAQAQAQRLHYEQHYPQADFLIAERASQAIGRLCLSLDTHQLRVVDIALLPACQGQGLGSRLLAAVLALADHLGKPCSLSVEPSSPAHRLYTRLGFKAREDQGVYLQMVRPVPADTPRSALMDT